MNVDDILAGLALGADVAHEQFQDSGERTNQRLHLTHHPHIHSVFYPLDNVEGVFYVALEDFELDVKTTQVISTIGLHGSPQENYLFWSGELSHGGQGDECVGYGGDWLQGTAVVRCRAVFYTANDVCALKSGHCFPHFTVIGRTIKRQTSESSLNIEAALVLCASVSRYHTFINILAAAAVRGQCVAIDRTGAVETTRSVVTAISADVATSGQRTLINVFTSHAIHVTQLVAPTTIALVGAINIRTLLAAGVGLTLIQIVTVPSVSCQLEACGAATFV